MEKKYYFDHAGQTKPYPEVICAMTQFLTEKWGNPSSDYELGNISRKALEQARAVVADSIGANLDQIIFTSGGCAGDSLIIRGVMQDVPVGGLLISPVQHKTIMTASIWLSEHGHYYKQVVVQPDGSVALESLSEALIDPVRLVSIMAANNEVGTINNIAELSKIAHQKGSLFHSDCVQLYMKGKINVNELDLDFATFSGHKIGAPMGTGFIYAKDPKSLSPLIFGSQEQGLFGGTENVPGIVGLAKAVQINQKNMEREIQRETVLRDYMIGKILGCVEGTTLNGSKDNRLCNNINIHFEGIKGEEMVGFLNLYDICCSSGSACNTSDGKPSYVLKAMGCSDEWAQSSVRFTIGTDTTIEDIDYVIDKIEQSVKYLRR